MTTTTLPPTATYAAAYAKLAAIAEKLRATGGAATIDTLVDDIRAARAAHAVCKTRIQEVMKEFEAEVAGVEKGEEVF